MSAYPALPLWLATGQSPPPVIRRQWSAVSVLAVGGRSVCRCGQQVFAESSEGPHDVSIDRSLPCG